MCVRTTDDKLLAGHDQQHLVCFLHAPPSTWKVVTTIDNPDALCKLKQIVTRSPVEGNCEMMKSHQTNSTLLSLTERDEAILDEITRDEYEMLGKYLPTAAP